MAGGHPLQFAFKIQTGIDNRSEKSRLANLLKNSESGRAHQWIAVERAPLAAMFETGSRSSCQQRGERHASPDALSPRHVSILNPGMLVVKKLSGTTHAL